jgi:hypothetical protein
MKIAQLAGLALALSIAAPAGAQLVTAKDPQSVIRALQAEGYKAKLDKDDEGDPKIISSASGSEFFVNFYGCEKNRNCTSIHFASGYDPDSGKGPALAAINAWNKDKRYSKAWLDDDGDYWLELDLYTGAAGISTDVFTKHLNIWTTQMGEFEKATGWND